MKQVLIFNPDNDLALADGGLNYIPPAIVRKMAADLAVLPIWYAPSDSYVIASPLLNQDFLNNMQEAFHLDSKLITLPELADNGDIEIVPWGWNHSLAHSLESLGLSITNLPSHNQIEQIKALSHRSKAVDLLSKLDASIHYCGDSTYVTTIDECQSYISSHPQTLLKSPLSGSGKGLNWCKGEFTPNIQGWCQRVIQSQGGVVIEPVYCKEIDCAMEFYSDGQGTVSFEGYSYFETSQSGFYEANHLMSDVMIEAKLHSYVPQSAILELRTKLQTELSTLVGSQYKGYLGVDMMICHFHDKPYYRIHPCVEINLRMNMGVVSHIINERYVAPSSKGIFKIGFHPAHTGIMAYYKAMSVLHPLQDVDGKVVRGYLPLTPIYADTQYHAFILIE